MSAIFSIPGNSCVVHGSHWPVPLRTVKHHILPLEFGGPNVASNLVLTCDTGHYNIHTVLNALLKGETPPKSTRKERAYAQQGYDAIQAKVGPGYTALMENYLKSLDG